MSVISEEIRVFSLLVLLVSVLSLEVKTAAFGSNKTIRCRENERQALLSFKEGLVDEYGHLSSWGTPDCCTWRGVGCSSRTGHVLKLDLNVSTWPIETPLVGTVNPSLLELQHLNYLDLSLNDFAGTTIPEFIGSLKNLRYLYLVGAGFSGPIPHQLGNLSRLESLSLRWNNLYAAGKLDWLSNLSSLKDIDLSFDDLSEADNWVQVVNNLPFLESLSLMYCNLPRILPASLSLANSTSSLTFLDLSNNNLTSSAIFPWLFNISSNLFHLDLRGTQLDGLIPEAFGNMNSLDNLYLSFNQLEGGIPKSFGNMCSLRFLTLYSNNLSGELSGFIGNLSGCLENSLEVLGLGWNQIRGSLPNEITSFSSLKELSLNRNLLSGTITTNISYMSRLEALDLDHNFFEGVFSEVHLSNLSKLQELSLGSNPNLALRFSPDWVPPFQLDKIYLGSCMLGPEFPRWFQTQKRYYWLDISYASILDTVPNWFWEGLPPYLIYLDLSHNEMMGKLPKMSLNFLGFPAIYLSSNYFEGPIQMLPSNVSSFDLSNNSFSGSISFLCTITPQYLELLDLSNNLLSGELPDCWMQFGNFGILNLANNGFSGSIPPSIGSLGNINSLNLRNNRFSGTLPSLKDCKNMRYLDLGSNLLSGNIPQWIGESLPNLVVLSLRSNGFYGNIPPQLCHLENMQIVDLSENSISGTIPKCLQNLTTMTVQTSLNATISHLYLSFQGGTKAINMLLEYIDKAILGWKGRNDEYRNTLGLVKIIDLSSNRLNGEIPQEIGSLEGLIGLNLSRNYLTGPIPQKIGQLNLLDFLDLSHNQLYGAIPSTLSQINRLSFMDLSDNNLWGKIPLGTQLQSFNASSYAGNSGLCGPPLPNGCPREDQNNPTVSIEDKDGDGIITLGFYVSLVVGFAVGFWGVCGSLTLKSSWRYAYFRLLNNARDWLYVRAALSKAQMRRKFISLTAR